MGTAKAARDSEFQALLPLRGKILNTHRATVKAALDNAEVASIVSALGAGMGPTFDLEQLRYDKVIVTTDADVDGAHIRCLLLTLFHRYMAPMLAAGRVYAAMPPLFKIVEAGTGKVHYCHSDEERDRVLAEMERHDRRPKAVMRNKGLGEMDAPELRDTTMNPETRTLRRVTMSEARESSEMFELLMGTEVAPRREYITVHALSMAAADIDA